MTVISASTDQLLDLDGIGQRSETFRWELLDRTGAKIGEIQPERGAVPTITNNTQSSVMRSLNNFTLGPDVGEQFAEIGARVRPVMVLENGAEGPLGIFRFVSASRLRNRYGVAFQGSLLDDGVVLDQPIPETYSLNAGASIDQAIINLCTDVGISNVEMDATGVVVGFPIVWPPNTSRRQIVNELCAKSGRLPLWFNNAGIPQVRVTPDLATAPVAVSYRDGVNIGEDITESNDLLNAPNSFTAVCTSASNTEIVGTYNLPDSAPNSEYHLGYVIRHVITEQGLASTAAAAERARTAAVLDNRVYQHASYSGAPDFRHDTFQVLSFRGERFFEQQWNLECKAGGNHAHDLQRLYA